MTDDMISRQKTIKWVKIECNPYGKPTLDLESGEKVIKHLKQMLSIDAVPVVRCAECISFDTEGDGFGICQLHEMTRREEDFCSDGERSEASLCDNCDEQSENCSWCKRMERSEE